MARSNFSDPTWVGSENGDIFAARSGKHPADAVDLLHFVRRSMAEAEKKGKSVVQMCGKKG